MANTTYTVPLLPLARTRAIIAGIAHHAAAWEQNYNAAFVSIVRNNATGNMEYTFSNPVPQVEIDALKGSL